MTRPSLAHHPRTSEEPRRVSSPTPTRRPNARGRISDNSLDWLEKFSDIIAVRTIIFMPGAAKDLDALPRADREAVENGLHAYAINGLGDVKRLKGREGFRLRIGHYRVIFDQDAQTILAIYIGRRATTTYRMG